MSITRIWCLMLGAGCLGAAFPQSGTGNVVTYPTAVLSTLEAPRVKSEFIAKPLNEQQKAKLAAARESLAKAQAEFNAAERALKAEFGQTSSGFTDGQTFMRNAVCYYGHTDVEIRGDFALITSTTHPWCE